MNTCKNIFLLGVVVSAFVCSLAQYHGYHGGHHGEHGLEPQYGAAHGEKKDYYAPPHYSYEYNVHDPHTGDVKSQHESRRGDVVKGFYTLKEADGTLREVHYSADKHNGFNAEVKRTGHASHYQPHQYHH